MTDMRFRVLGPIEVAVDDRPINLGGAKQRTLLAALVAKRNRPVTSDVLIEMLWGDHAPATAHKSIQKYVSALRKDLGDDLLTRAGGYVVSVGDDAIDAEVFEGLVAEARRSFQPESLLEDALALWRGDPYPELIDAEAAFAEVARLTELRAEAEELLIDARLAGGRHAEIIGSIEDLISKNPYRERLWGQLMLALYRAGRQTEALDAYRRLRRTLGEELGIEPSDELQHLEEQILLHDPALDAIVAVPGNLPAAVTSLVGRSREQDRVSELLSSSRLITLLGPAGSGKTRLALEMGRSRARRFQSGVWFVDLAPVRSPDQVVDAVAGPLGVGGAAERSTESVLAEFLSPRRLLLIVDNCEHLVAKIAGVLADLLRAAPGLVVIATSRERLGIEGEAIFDVPPLPYPTPEDEATEDFDAVRLFLERARAVDAGVDHALEQATIGEIVRRLDGMPLAIELAAARVRTLGLFELIDGLNDRFSLLASPSRGRLERHQTLEAAVDWSYQLLDPDEQTLFRRLSVFRGGFDLDSAAEVCGYAPLAEDRIVGLASNLADKSLVAVSPMTLGRRRYFMLETLREFAQVVLDPTETRAMRDAHAVHFMRFAEEASMQLRGPDQTKWFAALSADHDNMRKALDWAAATDPEIAVQLAVALTKYWDSVGPRAEGHEWLRRAVDLSRPLDPRLHIEALLGASDMFSSYHASLPRRFAEEALDLARSLGDGWGEARALRALSWALSLDEYPDEAVAVGLEALPVFEEGDDPWELALCLERLGQASYADPAWSVEKLERACQIYSEVGDRSREALTLYKMADRLAHSLDDLDTAKVYAKEAVEICAEVGNFHDLAHAKLEYGKVLRRAGEPDRASVVLREAFDQLTKSGDERCSVRALTALGTSLLAGGDSEDAAETLRESLRRGRELDERHTSRAALAGLAGIMTEEGREAEAVVLYGIVDRLGQTLAVPVSETSKTKRDALLASLRERVGPTEFDHAWAQGREMTLDEAMKIALGPAVG
jgi:predicted ATPase